MYSVKAKEMEFPSGRKFRVQTVVLWSEDDDYNKAFAKQEPGNMKELAEQVYQIVRLQHPDAKKGEVLKDVDLAFAQQVLEAAWSLAKDETEKKTT